MPDTSKLEKLNRELEKSEKKLRKAINDEKALQHQLKQLTRKERTHRLCTRGGMLESFLQEPERLTYTPTCSQYGLEAIQKYGAFKGSLLACWRILRCNPFSKGGYDPVP